MKIFFADTSESNVAIVLFWHIANIFWLSEHVVSIIGALLSTIVLIITKILRWRNEMLVKEQHEIDLRIKKLQEQKLKNEIGNIKKVD